MSMLWNDFASAYIPHIYPQHGPWRNASEHAINPNLWGAPLDLSEDPPEWLAEDVDLGTPRIAYPPLIEAAQYTYDMVAKCRQKVTTKPFYRFDPWADRRLYERNKYGKLERLEIYNEWLQICTGAYGEEASPTDVLGVSLLLAERYYEQPPGSGRIFDDEIEDANGFSASSDGQIDALADFSPRALAKEECQQEDMITLNESPREPATPARFLGVNPWMGQWVHPDANGYTGVLRQSVPSRHDLYHDCR